uniref:Uncharacterized protein n=1 Tax=Arundo donax TaxID=35708 RepID=A0A0A9CEW6_ARUDO
MEGEIMLWSMSSFWLHRRSHKELKKIEAELSRIADEEGTYRVVVEDWLKKMTMAFHLRALEEDADEMAFHIEEDAQVESKTITKEDSPNEMGGDPLLVWRIYSCRRKEQEEE